MLQQLRLAGEGLLCLGAVPGGQSLLLRHGLLRLLPTAGVVLQTAGQALQLSFQVFQVLPQGAEQTVIVVLGTLQPQHLVFGLTALGLRRLQLVLGGVQLPLGGLLLLLSLCELPVHGGAAALELLQLRRPAQNAGGAVGGAAGHGAAPVDHLPVQCHDPEGVAVLPGHGDAAVQVLHDDGPAQEAVENILVFGVKSHQTGGKAHKAELALHAPFPQLLAPDGRQRQEGGPAAVPLL